jgi:hypothetical protein
MIDLLLDPDKALDAVNKAVKLVKKAAATVDNVESLGPVLGKYFDAKSTAVAVAQKAASGGFGGSMKGKALEIELALESQKDFERQIKDLFFASNKMDVWMRIEARTKQMEVDAAKAMASEKRAAAKKKKEQEEAIELTVAIVLVVALLIGLLWGGWELLQMCKGGKCGR